MAKLTAEQWVEMRVEWEASPRQGTEWLARDYGGTWDISAEAIRKKRIRDEAKGDPWVKPIRMSAVMQRARLLADAMTSDVVPERVGMPSIGVTPAESIEEGAAERPESIEGGPPPAAAPITPLEEVAIDLRSRLIETHRREWRVARGLAVKVIQEAQIARGYNVAKFAKVITEILTAIQAGERKAWGLDADLIDLEGLSNEQLAQLAAGKTPK